MLGIFVYTTRMGKCSRCNRPLIGYPKPWGVNCELMPVLEKEETHVDSENPSGDSSEQVFESAILQENDMHG